MKEIIIETLGADTKRGVFVINDDIYIKYDDIQDDFETTGTISAEVEYDQEKYTIPQIEDLIYVLFIRILEDYSPKVQENALIEQADETQLKDSNEQK